MSPAACVEFGYFLLVWEFTSLRMKPQVHTLTSPPVPNYTLSPDLFLLPVLAPPEAPKPVQFWDLDTALCSAATGNPSPRPVVRPPRHPGLQSGPPPSPAWPLNATVPWSPKSNHFPSVTGRGQNDRVLPFLHTCTQAKTPSRGLALFSERRLHSLWWPVRGWPHILVCPGQSHFTCYCSNIIINSTLFSSKSCPNFHSNPDDLFSNKPLWGLAPASLPSPMSLHCPLHSLLAFVYSLTLICWLYTRRQPCARSWTQGREQKRQDQGPSQPAPTCPWAHTGASFSLFITETFWGPGHPTLHLASSIMCLSLKQWFKAAIFPASVWFIWLPDSSKRWWSLRLFGGGGGQGAEAPHPLHHRHPSSAETHSVLCTDSHAQQRAAWQTVAKGKRDSKMKIGTR